MTIPNTLVLSQEPFLRLGLRFYVLSKLQAPACHEAKSLAEAETLLAAHSVGLMLLGACAQPEAVPRWVETLQRKHPRVPVIVVCQSPTPDDLRRLLRAGASGVVTNLDTKEEMRHAVEAALNGARHVSGRASGSLIAALDDLHIPVEAVGLGSLSSREREVFELIGERCTTKDIALRLGIGEKTVETHKHRIKTKLRLDHTAQVRQAAAAAHALKHPETAGLRRAAAKS